MKRTRNTIDDWYKTFFSGLAVDVWNAVVPHEFTESELQLLQDCFPTSSTLLDLFSGAGRHALPLARLGYDVMCFDISKQSLDQLARAARREHLHIKTQRGDFLSASLRRRFDGVYCMGNSFSYANRNGMQRIIDSIARLLTPGGRAIINTAMLAESVIPNWIENEWMEVGSIYFLRTNHYDAECGRIETEMIFKKGRVTERRTSHHWVFTLAEMTSMFGRAGLEREAVYSTPDKTPFRFADPNAYICLRKIDLPTPRG